MTVYSLWLVLVGVFGTALINFAYDHTRKWNGIVALAIGSICLLALVAVVFFAYSLSVAMTR